MKKSNVIKMGKVSVYMKEAFKPEGNSYYGYYIGIKVGKRHKDYLQALSMKEVDLSNDNKVLEYIKGHLLEVQNGGYIGQKEQLENLFYGHGKDEIFNFSCTAECFGRYIYNFQKENGMI